MGIRKLGAERLALSFYTARTMSLCSPQQPASLQPQTDIFQTQPCDFTAVIIATAYGVPTLRQATITEHQNQQLLALDPNEALKLAALLGVHLLHHIRLLF